MQCSQHNSLAVQVEMKALFPPFARLKRTQPVWTAAFVNVFSTVTSVWQGRDQATRLHVNENEAFFKYKSPRKPHLGRWSLMEPPPPLVYICICSCCVPSVAAAGGVGAQRSLCVWMVRRKTVAVIIFGASASLPTKISLRPSTSYLHVFKNILSERFLSIGDVMVQSKKRC